MYTKFFDLREKPFNLTPSPRFLYLGESHKEALALLRYGIMERKGFVLLTGEVGTGKTTVVQALLQSLDKNIQIVYLSNPLMKAHDFIDYLGFQALKRTEHYKSKAEFLLEFEAFLKTCRRDQRNFVLIIDEAQRLSFAILEEIRLLSNMESAEEKLINIFLVGQPELNDKLSDPRCRPLLQRIAIRHHISPLDLSEAGDYIIARLAAAGAEEPKEIFSKEVIKAIHHHSSGYPRMINVLADNSLLLGYSKRTRKITPAMVMESYKDLQLEGSALKASEEQSNKADDRAKSPLKRRANWRWVVAAFLLGMGIAAFLIVYFEKGGIDRFTVLQSGSEQSDPRREDKMVVREKLPAAGSAAASEKDLAEVRRPILDPPKGLAKPIETPSSLIPKVERSETLITPDAAKRSEVPGLPPKAQPSEAFVTPDAAKRSEAMPTAPTTVVVKQGDTLAELSATIYGRFDQEVLRLIKEQNPGLPDVNRIKAGQEIVFPAVEKSLKFSSFTVRVSSSRNFDSALELSAHFQKDGKESYIIPSQDSRKSKIYLVTLGLFKDHPSAQSYAARLLQEKTVQRAEVFEIGKKVSGLSSQEEVR